MKHLPSEQQSLELLPFIIQSSPKALGLGMVREHQGRDTHSTEPQRGQGGKKGRGQYCSPDLSFIPNTLSLTTLVIHMVTQPCINCVSFFKIENDSILL